MKILPKIALAVLAAAGTGLAAEAPGTDDGGKKFDEILTGLADPARRAAAAKAVEFLPAEAIPAFVDALARPDLGPEPRAALEKAFAPLFEKHPAEFRRKKTADRLAFYRRTLIDAYEKVGRKNAKWDAEARKALEAAAAWWADPERKGDEEDTVLEAGQKAMNAKCDDPIVRYVYARAVLVAEPDGFHKGLRHLGMVGKDLQSADYPAFLRISACSWDIGMRLLTTASDRVDAAGEMEKRLDRAVELLPDAVREGTPARDLIEMARDLLERYARLHEDRKKGFDKVKAAVEKALPGGVVPLSVEGEFLVQYAWDARGGGWANTVTEAGRKGFRERLASAQAALEAAWKKDPSEDAAPTAMITVAKGRGLPAEQGELWYRRAVRADPFSEDPQAAFMDFLEPKWGGSAEDLLAFGRACLKDPETQGRQAMALAEAHIRLSRYGKGGYVFTGDPEYYRAPGVWKDMKEAFDACLKVRPADLYARCRYAWYATRCEQWAAAFEQFKGLGRSARSRVFPDGAPLDRLRQKAAVLASPGAVNWEKAKEKEKSGDWAGVTAELEAGLARDLEPEAKRAFHSFRRTVEIRKALDGKEWVDLKPEEGLPGWEIGEGRFEGWRRDGDAIVATAATAVNCLALACDLDNLEIEGTMECTRGAGGRNVSVIIGYNEEKPEDLVGITARYGWKAWCIEKHFDGGDREPAGEFPNGPIPFRIRHVDGKVQVFQGEKKVAERVFPKPLAGRIGLGGYFTGTGSEIRFEKLRLRRLQKGEE